MRSYSSIRIPVIPLILAGCLWLPAGSLPAAEPEPEAPPEAVGAAPEAAQADTPEGAPQTGQTGPAGADEVEGQEEAPAAEETDERPSDVESTATKGDLSFWRRSADWLVDYRDDISAGIESMATGIDRFFAGDAALRDENKSFARIRAGLRFEEGDGFSQVSDFKFRLSLPATQKKLRLVIENDADDEDSLESRNRPSSVSETSDDNDNFSAALQFITSEADRWDSKAELGLRATAPIDIFVRHTAKRRWDIEGPWSMSFRQRWAYFKESGYRANEELNFERRINDDWFYRMKTEVEWREEVDSMRAAQVFAFYHRIDDKRGVEYQAGTIAHSRHHTVIDNSYLAIDYRQLLYRDWLYLDVIPEIVFPREDDYDPTSSLTVRLEILFFED